MHSLPDETSAERRRALLVFRHVYGHHVSDAEAFVELLSDWGWSIHVLADPEIERVAPGLPFLERVEKVEKIPLGRPWSSLSTLERYCQISAIDLVVFVTFDEWLVDLFVQRALRRRPLQFRVFGILHHLSKSGGFFRRIQGALALQGWRGADRCVGHLRVGCLTDESLQLAQRHNPRVRAARIPYVHKIRREAFTRVLRPEDKEGIRLLIFGAMRADKRIIEVIQALRKIAVSEDGNGLELTLAGRFGEEAYAGRVRHCMELANSETSSLKITLKEGFVTDDEKADLFGRAHIVVISNSGGDFEGRMISGVLLDAVHFRTPMICTDTFPLPEGMPESARFDLAAPETLGAAIEDVVHRYVEMVAAYDNLGGGLIDGFTNHFREQAFDLVGDS